MGCVYDVSVMETGYQNTIRKDGAENDNYPVSILLRPFFNHLASRLRTLRRLASLHSSAFSMGARKGRGYSITPRPDLSYGAGQHGEHACDGDRGHRITANQAMPVNPGRTPRPNGHIGSATIEMGRLIRCTCRRESGPSTTFLPYCASAQNGPSQRATDGAGSRHPVLSRLPFLLTTWDIPTDIANRCRATLTTQTTADGNCALTPAQSIEVPLATNKCWHCPPLQPAT